LQARGCSRCYGIVPRRCRSLAGGTLLLTELAGADGRIYAVAQGPVQSGADARATVGRVPAGATVERHVAMDLLAPDGSLVLSLLNPDYTTAARIARAVCERFEEGAAVAVDGGTVRGGCSGMAPGDPDAFHC